MVHSIVFVCLVIGSISFTPQPHYMLSSVYPCVLLHSLANPCIFSLSHSCRFLKHFHTISVYFIKLSCGTAGWSKPKLKLICGIFFHFLYVMHLSCSNVTCKGTLFNSNRSYIQWLLMVHFDLSILACYVRMFCRRGSFRERSFICWEAAAMYDTIWLHSRPAKWSQVEGDQTNGTQRTRRIRHTESWRYYWRHLPRGCADGKSAIADYLIFSRVLHSLVTFTFGLIHFCIGIFSILLLGQSCSCLAFLTKTQSIWYFLASK